VPRKFTPPSTSAVHNRISETRGHIDNASSDAQAAKSSIGRAKELGKDNPELVLQLNAALTQIDDLTKSLLSAKASNADAELKLADADKKVETMTNAINKREVKAAEAINRYHRLKLWLCLAGAAVVGLVGAYFAVPLLALGPWGIGIMVGAPIATFGALWWFL
jgi:ElaB/YqjD/DUF883 family membrane-anchored ribosome-binding protein